jgi:uncharacterized protein YaeQ
MALRATVYRADLAVSDLDRGVYANHALTLARHPSETEMRLMLRLLAFALFADDRLTFGRGLSTEDEPALWQRDATGQIERWIDVGLPGLKDVRKASGRAAEVVVLAFGERRRAEWWSQIGSELQRIDNLQVLTLSDAETSAIEQLAARAMQVSCTIQERHVWFSVNAQSIEIAPGLLPPAGAS